MQQVVLVVAPIAEGDGVVPAPPRGVASALVPGQEVAMQGVAVRVAAVPPLPVARVGPGVP